jgi:hypothetical protein
MLICFDVGKRAILSSRLQQLQFVLSFLALLQSFHLSGLRLSRGTFYFGQLGTFHFGATHVGGRTAGTSHL